MRMVLVKDDRANGVLGWIWAWKIDFPQAYQFLEGWDIELLVLVGFPVIALLGN